MGVLGQNELEAIFKADISFDHYSATLLIQKKAEQSVFPADLKAFLFRKGITHGVIDSKVSEAATMAEAGLVGRSIVVAEGKRKEQGKPGSEEYSFRTTLLAGKISDKKIDFKERGAINSVSEGQVLARIVLPDKGKPGILINGSIDPQDNVPTIRIPTAGKHVELRKDGNTLTFLSQSAGHVRMRFGEIQVFPDFSINGDLDFTVGNIEYGGNVSIHGSIKPGFKIKAGGDVVIGGDIGAEAIIDVSGDLIVRGTIAIGKTKGMVSVGGDLSADRITGSKIFCAGNIMAKSQISDSIIDCWGKFVTKFGKIFGCDIEAIGGVVVNNLGLEQSNTDNIISIGIPTKIVQRLEKIEEELKRVVNEQQLLIKSYEAQFGKGYRESQFEKLTPDEQDKIKRLGQAMTKHGKTLQTERETLENEKKELNSRMKYDQTAVVQVEGFIYPTCIIHAGKKELKFLDSKAAPGIIYQ